MSRSRSFRRLACCACLYGLLPVAAYAAQPREPRGPDPELDAALKACAAEQGLPPPPAPHEADDGTRPEQAGARPDRRKFNDCMTGKGFPPPPPRRHHGHPDDETLPPPPED